MFCVALAVFLDARIARVPCSAVARIDLVSTPFFPFVCCVCSPGRHRFCITGRCLHGTRRCRASPFRLVAAASKLSCGFCVRDVCRFVFHLRRSTPSPSASVYLPYRRWCSPLPTASSAFTLVLASVTVVFAAASALAASTLALPASVLAAAPPVLDSAFSSARMAAAVVAGAAAALAAPAPVTTSSSSGLFPTFCTPVVSGFGGFSVCLPSFAAGRFTVCVSGLSYRVPFAAVCVCVRCMHLHGRRLRAPLATSAAVFALGHVSVAVVVTSASSLASASLVLPASVLAAAAPALAVTLSPPPS